MCYGKRYSAYGMTELWRMGIEELHIKNIYWCVSCVNERAVRFYDKKQYVITEDVPESIKDCYSEEQNKEFIWYVFAKNKRIF